MTHPPTQSLRSQAATFGLTTEEFDLAAEQLGRDGLGGWVMGTPQKKR